MSILSEYHLGEKRPITWYITRTITWYNTFSPVLPIRVTDRDGNTVTARARFKLVREEDNAFDPYAVAIYYNDYKLGFIPRAHNHDISKYLDMGLHDIYEVRITRLTPDVQPEQQVEVIVNILNQK